MLASQPALYEVGFAVSASIRSANPESYGASIEFDDGRQPFPRPQPKRSIFTVPEHVCACKYITQCETGICRSTKGGALRRLYDRCIRN